MKVNLKNIIIEEGRIVVENEEYDHNGILIETPAEKYDLPLSAGTIIDYDSEYILILENNGYTNLEYSDSIRYLDYDWASDPRTMNIYPPFKDKKSMKEWIEDNKHHKQSLEKYYKKVFFKN